MRISKQLFVKKYKKLKNCNTRTALKKWTTCLARFGTDLRRTKFGHIGDINDQNYPRVLYNIIDGKRTKVTLIEYKSRLDGNQWQERPWNYCFVFKQIDGASIERNFIFDADEPLVFGFYANRMNIRPSVQIPERYILASDVINQEAINTIHRQRHRRGREQLFRKYLRRSMQRNGCLEVINGLIIFDNRVRIQPEFDVEERISDNHCKPDPQNPQYCNFFINFMGEGQFAHKRYFHLSLFSEEVAAMVDNIGRLDTRAYVPHFYHLKLEDDFMVDLMARYHIPDSQSKYWMFYYDVIEQKFEFVPQGDNTIITDLENNGDEASLRMADRFKAFLRCLADFFMYLINDRPILLRPPPYNVPHILPHNANANANNANANQIDSLDPGLCRVYRNDILEINQHLAGP